MALDQGVPEDIPEAQGEHASSKHTEQGQELNLQPQRCCHHAHILLTIQQEIIDDINDVSALLH